MKCRASGGKRLVSPTTRNHLWITNGLAAYSELLWTEHDVGPGAMQTALKGVMVDSLTVDTVPIIQSSRLEDYSPELWALTGAKGATVLSMLRNMLGDEKFFEVLKTFAQDDGWKPVNTDDFQKVAETVSKKELGYFFTEWIESSGAPQFKLEYTVFREQQKGFRVMGKITQDLDTFRMPVDLKHHHRRKSRGGQGGSGGHFLGIQRGHLRQAEERRDRPQQHGAALRAHIRVAVAIRKGEQFAANLSEFGDAHPEYQKALETNRTSSLAHYRMAEVYFLQQTWQSAINEFREALNGDLTPKWTEVWAHINMGRIYDISGSRDRAVNEYNRRFVPRIIPRAPRRKPPNC
jgi:tetratricopeptide (TPR) repeat protein